jgi:hypothetical protein
MADLPYNPRKGDGITKAAEMLEYLWLNPLSFFDVGYMDSYLPLLRPVQGEVMEIYNAQSDCIHSAPRDKMRSVPGTDGISRSTEDILLTLKFDRRLALAVSYSKRKTRLRG